MLVSQKQSITRFFKQYMPTLNIHQFSTLSAQQFIIMIPDLIVLISFFFLSVYR